MASVTNHHGRILEPNWPTFRKVYPQFEDEAKYPDDYLEMVWEQVSCIVSDADYGSIMGDCRIFLLYMLVCHFLTLINNGSQQGDQGGFITSSTIDKVSVTKAAPPSPNQFSWWLNQTPCGQMALAAMEAASAGGYYIGGAPEVAGFRRVGGFFRPSTY